MTQEKPNLGKPVRERASLLLSKLNSKRLQLISAAHFIGTHSNAQRSKSAVRPAEKLVFCLLYGPETSFISAAQNPRKGTACPPASPLKYAQTAAIFGTLPKTKVQPRNQQYGLTRAACLLYDFLLAVFTLAVFSLLCVSAGMMKVRLSQPLLNDQRVGTFNPCSSSLAETRLCSSRSLFLLYAEDGKQ